MLSIDPNALPNDVDLLHKIVVELCERLKHETSEKDKYRTLLRELLEAQRNRKSEQLSKDQLALFATLWKASHPEEEEPPDPEPTTEEEEETEAGGAANQEAKRAAAAGAASGAGASGARSAGTGKALRLLWQGSAADR